MKHISFIIIGVILTIAIASLIAWAICQHSTSTIIESMPPEFQELARSGASSGKKTRVELARNFASAQPDSPWILLALLDDEVVSGLDVSDREFLAAEDSRRQFDLAVIAAVIEGIGKSNNPHILFAITCFLEVEDRGRYSSAEFGRMAEHQTEPIRDLARDVLSRSLGVDHQYDTKMWREEIVEYFDEHHLDEHR